MIFENLIIRSIEISLRSMSDKFCNLRLELNKVNCDINLMLKYSEEVLKMKISSEPLEQDDRNYVYFFINYFRIKKLDDLVVDAIRFYVFINDFNSTYLNHLKRLDCQLNTVIRSDRHNLDHSDLLEHKFTINQQHQINADTTVERFQIIKDLKLLICDFDNELNEFVNFEIKLFNLLFDQLKKLINYFDEYCSKQNKNRITLLNLRSHKINKIKNDLIFLKQCTHLSDTLKQSKQYNENINRLETELNSKCQEIDLKSDLIELILPNDNECLFFSFDLLNEFTATLDLIEFKLDELKLKVDDIIKSNQFVNGDHFADFDDRMQEESTNSNNSSSNDSTLVDRSNQFRKDDDLDMSEEMLLGRSLNRTINFLPKDVFEDVFKDVSKNVSTNESKDVSKDDSKDDLIDKLMVHSRSIESSTKSTPLTSIHRSSDEMSNSESTNKSSFKNETIDKSSNIRSKTRSIYVSPVKKSKSTNLNSASSSIDKNHHKSFANVLTFKLNLNNTSTPSNKTSKVLSNLNSSSTTRSTIATKSKSTNKYCSKENRSDYQINRKPRKARASDRSNKLSRFSCHY